LIFTLDLDLFTFSIEWGIVCVLWKDIDSDILTISRICVA